LLTQDQPLLLIGQVADQSGVPIKTIRYYEELGLLHPSGRTEGGFRQFSPQILARLAFIKRSQSLGLSLQEIGEILEVYDHGELPCGQVKNKLEHKLLEVDQQIHQLQILQAELNGLLSGWESFSVEKNGTICPIIETTQTPSTTSTSE